MTTSTLWQDIKLEAEKDAKEEPILSSFLYETILNHKKIDDALSFHLASKLQSSTLPAMLLREIFDDAYRSDKTIIKAICEDLRAFARRDPASMGYSYPFLYYKGFHALECFRISNWLWKNNRKPLAFVMQSRITECFGVDIHPAATLGSGIFIDHATGVVIGETAVVEDKVSILHEVTLGGTGKEKGDRHPKIRSGVLIGAGTKVLGNIEVGKCSKIGACSVVLEDVPPNSTVVGVPAKVVGKTDCDKPYMEMDQFIESGCYCRKQNKDQ